MAEQILIELVADASKVQPAVEILQKLGQISDAELAEIKKLTDTASKGFDSMNKNAAATVPTLKKVETAVDSLVETFLEGFQEGMADALADAGVGLDNFGKKTQQTEGKAQSMKARLRELKQELQQLEDAGKDGTEAFQKMAVEAAKLEDQIGDTNARVRALSSDTANMDAAVQGISTLASGFQVAQGAAALLGGENDELMETMVRLQAVMAITNGIREIQLALQAQSILRLKAEAIGQSVLAVSTRLTSATFRVLGVSVTASSMAFKALRTAIITTGVGALVVGLGFLIEKLVSFSGASDDAADSTARLTAEIDIQNRALSNNLKGIDARTEKLLNDAKKRGAGEAELNAITVRGYAESARKAEESANRKLKADKAYYDATGTRLDVVIKNAKDASNALDGLQRAINGVTPIPLGMTKEDLEASKTIVQEALKDFEEAADFKKRIENANAQVTIKSNEEQRRKQKEAADEALRKQKEAAQKSREEREKDLKAGFELFKLYKEKEIALLNAEADLNIPAFSFRANALKQALDKEIELIRAQMNFQLENERHTNNERKLIIKKADDEIIQKKLEYANRLLLIQQSIADSDKQMLEETNQMLADEAQKQADKLGNIFKANVGGDRSEMIAEIQAQLDLFKQGTINREQYEQAKSEIQKKYARQDLVFEEQYLERKIQIDNLSKDEITQAEERLAEIKKQLRDQDIADQEAAAEKEIEIARQKEELKQQIISSGFQITRELSDSIFEGDVERRRNVLDAELSRLDRQKQKELDNKNVTEQQKADIEAKYAERIRQIKIRDWKAEQKAKEQQALINGALAITNILATRPKFDLGIGDAIMIAAAVASTAIQVQKIKSLPVPQFAKGTRNAPRGYAWVGEEGPELMHLNGGEKIWTYNQSKKVKQAWENGMPGSPDEILAGHLPSKVDPELISKSYVLGNGALALDYEKLGRSLAKHMPAPVQNNISIDKNGLQHYILESGNKTQIMNQRYKMNG